VAGTKQVTSRRSAFILASIGSMAAGIGMLKDLPAPPLGQGKVIIRFFVSTQSSGICVSRNLHPVARAISKDIGIHEGTPCTARGLPGDLDVIVRKDRFDPSDRPTLNSVVQKGY
jgi:hypothetical protein